MHLFLSVLFAGSCRFDFIFLRISRIHAVRLDSASFHPLTNRKHHCRLCGRIICSLPVKYPQRPETCSLLFVVDQSTGRIEEVGEGVDYGVRRRSTATPGKLKGETLSEDEKFLKGVRICRECRPVLLCVSPVTFS